MVLTSPAAILVVLQCRTPLIRIIYKCGLVYGRKCTVELEWSLVYIAESEGNESARTDDTVHGREL